MQLPICCSNKKQKIAHERQALDRLAHKLTRYTKSDPPQHLINQITTLRARVQEAKRIYEDHASNCEALAARKGA